MQDVLNSPNSRCGFFSFVINQMNSEAYIDFSLVYVNEIDMVFFWRPYIYVMWFAYVCVIFLTNNVDILYYE